MSEKIKLKGQLKLPVVGRNPIFAQMKFVKVALSEPDILPDSGSIFTCDEQGNYDFEIYTGKHLLSYNVGNAWSKSIEIIAEPLAEGLESIEISDLIGFQEIPELDAAIAALNQQKQELLLIQQDITDKQTAVATAADNIDSTVADVEAGYPDLLSKNMTANYHVSITGDDTNTGLTSLSSLRTISAALKKMHSGGSYTVTLSYGEHFVDKGETTNAASVIFSASTAGGRVSEKLAAGEAIDLASTAKVTFKKSTDASSSISSNGTVYFYNVLLATDVSEGWFASSGSTSVSARILVSPKRARFLNAGYLGDDYDISPVGVNSFSGEAFWEMGCESMTVSGKCDEMIRNVAVGKTSILTAWRTLAINSKNSSGGDTLIANESRINVLG